MGKALEILHESINKLEAEKKRWIKQKDFDAADKINEEILDINIAISELVSNGKSIETESSLSIDGISDSASVCECKKELLKEEYEFDTYPYGATVVELKCNKCGKVHSIRAF